VAGGTATRTHRGSSGLGTPKPQGGRRRDSRLNEHRLPIRPLHLERIDADLRKRIYFEHGYGEHFGLLDLRLART
jgi:hypothetical protein